MAGINIKEQHSRLGTKLDRENAIASKGKAKNGFLNNFVLYSKSSLLTRRGE